MSKKQIGASILLSALKCSNFGFSKSKQTPIFLEKGSILHDMLENMQPNGTFTYNKKGSAYYDKITLYVHEHDFAIYEETVKEFYNENRDLFIPKSNEEHIAELKFKKDFNEKYIIRGAIDRVILEKEYNSPVHKATLIDWKSGQNAISMVDLDDVKSIVQAVVYSWYMFTEYPTLQDVTFRWEYIEMGKSKSISFTREHLLYLKVLIINYIFILENGGLKLNSSCPFCANKETCSLIHNPIYPDLKTLSLKEIIKRGKDLKIIEKTIKEIMGKIKNRVKDLPNSNKHFGARTYNYLQINDKVPDSLKFLLLGDSVKVSKKDLKEYTKLYGDLDVLEKKSEVFKL